METTPYLERKTLELMNRINSSRWAVECLAEARRFMARGYASDVALTLASQYWLG